MREDALMREDDDLREDAFEDTLREDALLREDDDLREDREDALPIQSGYEDTHPI